MMPFDGAQYKNGGLIYPRAYSLGGAATPNWASLALQTAYWFSSRKMLICSHTYWADDSQLAGQDYVAGTTNFFDLLKLRNISIPEHVSRLSYTGVVMIQAIESDTATHKIVVSDGTNTDESSEVAESFNAEPWGGTPPPRNERGLRPPSERYDDPSLIAIEGLVELSNVSPPDDVVISVELKFDSSTTLVRPRTISLYWGAY